MGTPLSLLGAAALAGAIFLILPTETTGAAAPVNVATALTRAQAPDGKYISWREHRVDDEALGGVDIRGGDGLKIADLDKDGYADIVSVHEADTEYDGVLHGHIRIAFGTKSPDRWVLKTLAQGPEAAAAEDVTVADIDGDGYLDVVAAVELAHLIYFQNPGRGARTQTWKRVIPPVVDHRGSYIRVFAADLDGDGKPEIVAANKAAQAPKVTQPPSAISWFKIAGPPLDGASWVEHELAKVVWPINSQPVDLDRDGDIDVIGGSVAEGRIMLFENMGKSASPLFRERPITISGTSVFGDDRPADRRGDTRALISGFNMEFTDLNGDGRLDIVTWEFTRLVGRSIVWLEQPASLDGVWKLHPIGDYAPDLAVGIAVGDIDGDGLMDVMTGGYSFGPRDKDTDLTPTAISGRLAWFRNPGVAANPAAAWTRHDISRRRRGMYDQFVPRDMDGDGDLDFATTRGNSLTYDGVLWLEQVRTRAPAPAFRQARKVDSPEVPLPN